MEATSLWVGPLVRELINYILRGYGKHMETLEIIFYVVFLDFLHTWLSS